MLSRFKSIDQAKRDVLNRCLARKETMIHAVDSTEPIKYLLDEAADLEIENLIFREILQNIVDNDLLTDKTLNRKLSRLIDKRKV